MNTAEIIPFDFEMHAVRVVMDDEGMPWFVAKDVCDVLGIKNPRDALSRLDDDEKGVGNTDTLGGNQELLTVNESGLYALIFRSRKPEAKRFRKWVTSEVLPAIRSTGAYSMEDESEERGMAEQGRAWRLRESRKVMEDVTRLVQMADKAHPSQLDVINKATERLTGIDTIALLEESGWSRPGPTDAQQLEDLWQSRIEGYLAQQLQDAETGTEVFVRIGEVLKGSFDMDEPTLSDQQRCGRLMKRLRWRHRRKRRAGEDKWGYIPPLKIN